MIILMRHGRVSSRGKTWIWPSDLRGFIKAYDSAPVVPATHRLPPLCDTPFVVCSTLRRSQDSAVIRFGQYNHAAPLFREAELPDMFVSAIPMPAVFLMTLSRTSWLLGRTKGCESFVDFKKRAGEAAQSLIELSRKQPCVVLVGHGVLNRYIAYHLLQNGFKGAPRPSSKHWGCTTYVPAYVPATLRND